MQVEGCRNSLMWVRSGRCLGQKVAGQADMCFMCGSRCLGMLCHFYSLHAGCR